MIQVIFNFNYYIKSIGYGWINNIIDSDTREIFDIGLEDVKEYLHLHHSDPFNIEILWDRLKLIKGINNKEQIKSMIESKDLTLTDEVIFFDIANLINDNYDKNIIHLMNLCGME